MAAVYSNNDNRNSPNSRRFHLTVNPNPETRPPKVTPRVVEAKPIIYQNIYAIGIKWQVSEHGLVLCWLAGCRELKGSGCEDQQCW